MNAFCSFCSRLSPANNAATGIIIAAMQYKPLPVDDQQVVEIGASLLFSLELYRWLLLVLAKSFNYLGNKIRNHRYRKLLILSDGPGPNSGNCS